MITNNEWLIWIHHWIIQNSWFQFYRVYIYKITYTQWQSFITIHYWITTNDLNLYFLPGNKLILSDFQFICTFCVFPKLSDEIKILGWFWMLSFFGKSSNDLLVGHQLNKIKVAGFKVNQDKKTAFLMWPLSQHDVVFRHKH